MCTACDTLLSQVGIADLLSVSTFLYIRSQRIECIKTKLLILFLQTYGSKNRHKMGVIVQRG